MSGFSDRLVVERERIGWTQEKLAEHLNISRDTLSKWENKSGDPRKSQIESLCDLFGCDSGYLMGEIDCRRAASLPLSETLGISQKSLDILVDANKNGSPITDIVSLLIENEHFLHLINICVKTDYGNVSTIHELPDLSAPSGKRSFILNPKQLRQADCMELYNHLCNLIDQLRENNGI